MAPSSQWIIDITMRRCNRRRWFRQRSGFFQSRFQSNWLYAGCGLDLTSSTHVQRPVSSLGLTPDYAIDVLKAARVLGLLCLLDWSKSPALLELPLPPAQRLYCRALASLAAIRPTGTARNRSTNTTECRMTSFGTNDVEDVVETWRKQLSAMTDRNPPEQSRESAV